MRTNYKVGSVNKRRGERDGEEDQVSSRIELSALSTSLEQQQQRNRDDAEMYAVEESRENNEFVNVSVHPWSRRGSEQLDISLF